MSNLKERMALADRLSQGHAKGDAVSTSRRTRDEKLAAAFVPDSTQEKVIALRLRDPDAYDRLPHTTRMSAAYYAEAKKAHEREVADRG